MSVGKNIAKFRNNKKLSQRQLAGIVGVHPSMIAQIERDSKVPTITLARDIAKSLDVSLDDLV